MNSFGLAFILVIFCSLLAPITIQLATLTSWNDEEIHGYHFHVYFFQNNVIDTDEALSFREAIQDRIDQGILANCRLNTVNYGPRGPHPIGSYETCCNKTSISPAISWFMQNHGNLSVLLHALTRYEIEDHTKRSMFLGTRLPLDTAVLQEDLGDNLDLCLPLSKFQIICERLYSQHKAGKSGRVGNTKIRNCELPTNLLIRIMPICTTIPRHAEDITIEWLEKVLNLPSSTIRPETFSIRSNISADVGSLSNIVRVEFQELGHNASKSFIIKLLPVPTETNSSIIDVIRTDKFDQKEIYFYQTILPKLLEIEPSLENNFCKFYYGAQTENEGVEYSSVLVLQDLTPFQYSMQRFHSGLEPEELCELFEAIAKIHFAGRVLLHQEKNILETYPLLNDWRQPQNNPTVNEFNLFKIYKSLEWFQLGLISTIKDVFIPRGASQEMCDVYQKLIPAAPQIVLKIFEHGQKFPTIFHDDLWPHNFLISPSPNYPIKIIDWQLIGWLDSMYDLSHCLLSCLSIEKLNYNDIAEALDTYLEIYYKVQAKADQIAGESYRSKEECKKFFWNYGLGYSCLWFAMSADSIYANPEYVPKLFRIFEFLWEMKIPQFLLDIVII